MRDRKQRTTPFSVMTKYNYSDLWKISFPILISLLMEHMIGLTDTAFLGRLGGEAGEIALGASALAGVYYITMFMLGFGFSVGTQILIGRRNGEGQYGSIGAIFQQSALFQLVLAGALFTLTYAMSPMLLRNLINSDEVYQATMQYLDWRIYGAFFAFQAAIFRAFYVGTTRTKILTLNSLVMVGSNVILNYGLIFGKFGLPALGIAGAAIASVIAEAISLLFFVIYTSQKIDWRKYNLFRFRKFEPKILKQVLQLSIWTMIQQFLAVGTWFFFFLAIEHLGERSLAVTNIVRSVSAIFFVTVGAFATTGSTIVSNLMGAGQGRYVMSTMWKVIKLSYLVTLPVFLIIGFAPKLLLRIYTDNPDLINASVPSLWVMGTAYLIHVAGFNWFNAVSGTGNTRKAFLLEAVTLTIYAFYVYYIAYYLKADVAICWTSEHIYGVFTLLLSYSYMKWGKWQTKKI